jgi:hypothetical protein
VRRGGARFAADPRVELVGVVTRLAGKAPGSVAPAWAAFAGEFARFSDREAVRLRAAHRDDDALGLVAQLWSADARLEWARPRALLSADFFEAVGGPEALEGFRAALASFARESGFFAAWRARGRALAAPAAAAAAERWKRGKSDAAALESYLGERLPASLTFVLCGLYAPRRYSAYILPYPYPRPMETVLPRGPFEVITLIAAASEGAGLDEPLERGLLQELVYCWAEPFVWTYRGLLLGRERPADWQYALTRALVEGVAARAAAAAGRPFRLAPGGPLAASVREALEGFERGRTRSLTAYGPKLAAALAESAPRARAS